MGRVVVAHLAPANPPITSVSIDGPGGRKLVAREISTGETHLKTIELHKDGVVLTKWGVFRSEIREFAEALIAWCDQ